MKKDINWIKMGAIMFGAGLGLLITGLLTLCFSDTIAYALNTPIL